MDNFNLNAMGVKEMDSKEMKQTDGGNPIVKKLIQLFIEGALYETGKNAAEAVVGALHDGYSDMYANGHNPFGGTHM